MRRLAQLLVLAVTSLAVPAAVAAAPAAEPLRLGVGLFQPDKDKNDATYRPLADYLARALERPVQLRTVDSGEGLAKSLANGETDIALMGPWGYVLANHNRQLPEARRLVSRALKLEPNNPMLLDSMGWVEFRQGQLHAALDYLQRAYQLLPDAEIAAHLGEVLWVLGRQAEALVVWDKAIEAGDASGLVRRTQTRLQPAVQP